VYEIESLGILILGLHAGSFIGLEIYSTSSSHHTLFLHVFVDETTVNTKPGHSAYNFTFALLRLLLFFI